MTTLTQLRKTARSLPETAERPIRGGTIAFMVRDKQQPAYVSHSGTSTVSG